MGRWRSGCPRELRISYPLLELLCLLELLWLLELLCWLEGGLLAREDGLGRIAVDLLLWLQCCQAGLAKQRLAQLLGQLTSLHLRLADLLGLQRERACLLLLRLEVKLASKLVSKLVARPCWSPPILKTRRGEPLIDLALVLKLLGVEELVGLLKGKLLVPKLPGLSVKLWMALQVCLLHIVHVQNFV